MPQDVAPRIVVDPAVRCGRSVIRGTRVPADLVMAELAGGMSAQKVAEDNEIGVDDVRAALGYAASVLTAEEVRGTA